MSSYGLYSKDDTASHVNRPVAVRRHSFPRGHSEQLSEVIMDINSEDASPQDPNPRPLSLYADSSTGDSRPKTPQFPHRSPSKVSDASKQSKGTIKARKQTYRKEKKRAAKELSTALKDKSVIILSSWLKIRGTLKSWAKFWCVVKPGVLVIYKGNKHENWVGTVLLSTCEIRERPTSKEGFCFKLYHPLKQYIWTNKGPKGEIAGALAIPLPKDHLILRTSSESTGKCWLDALEVAQSSPLLHADKAMHSDLYGSSNAVDFDQMQEADRDDGDGLGIGEDGSVCDRSDELSTDGEPNEDPVEMDRRVFTTTDASDDHSASNYNRPTVECIGEVIEAGEETDDMGDENKSILWALLKQVRPGMDLSRVTLPTFILEPRSFLDKLADYYYHADILSRAARDDSPYNRMKDVVKWYLSGFYKKPKGLKKPYNPIIGEVFRCVWVPSSGGKTYYVAEQVSHHPPVSAFYCSNREDGFAVSGSILAKSKFYGNSTSAILDGSATLTFLKLGEDYTVTMPYAHIKGIFIGAITAEMGGTVRITCEKTGYQAEIDFKLKPFWKKSIDSNHIQGKIKLGNDVLSKLEGKWDGEVMITEYGTSDKSDIPLSTVFWEPTIEVQKLRLKRYTIDLDEQLESESENLWQNVTAALRDNDQENATKEKFVLEEEQRRIHKELKEKEEDWVPRFFARDPNSGSQHVWLYKYRDLRPWDPTNDVVQFEADGVIMTKARHVTPHVIRTSSLVNISKSLASLSGMRGERLPTIIEPEESDGGSRRGSGDYDNCSNVTLSEEEYEEATTSSRGNKLQLDSLRGNNATPLREILAAQKEASRQLIALRSDVRRLTADSRNSLGIQSRDVVIVLVLLLFQVVLQLLPLSSKK